MKKGTATRTWETDELEGGGIVYQGGSYQRGKPPAGQICFPTSGGIQLLYMSAAKEREILRNKLPTIRKTTAGHMPWWETIGFTSARGGTDIHQPNYDELWQSACLAVRAHDLPEHSEHPDKRDSASAFQVLQAFALNAVANLDPVRLHQLASMVETAKWYERDAEREWERSIGGKVIRALEEAARSAHERRRKPPAKSEVVRACGSESVSDKRIRQILHDFGFWWLPETRGRKRIGKP